MVLLLIMLLISELYYLMEVLLLLMHVRIQIYFGLYVEVRIFFNAVLFVLEQNWNLLIVYIILFL